MVERGGSQDASGTPQPIAVWFLSHFFMSADEPRGTL
jgi:hypothetical protein